jgi:transcriptional regulator with XRE-family HTH domain
VSAAALYATRRTLVLAGSNMAEMRSKSLGDVIRDARVAAKKGLREFSRELDIAPSYLSDIENDRRVPAEDVLRNIAASLGLNFDDLMALAGRFGDKTERYLRRTPEAGRLLRKISEKNLSDSEVRKLSEKADEFDDMKEGSP